MQACCRLRCWLSIGGLGALYTWYQVAEERLTHALPRHPAMQQQNIAEILPATPASEGQPVVFSSAPHVSEMFRHRVYVRIYV